MRKTLNKGAFDEYNSWAKENPKIFEKIVKLFNILSTDQLNL